LIDQALIGQTLVRQSIHWAGGRRALVGLALTGEALIGPALTANH
jgi:hypothetical protein